MSDQKTYFAEPLCFQRVRFEDLYRFSLSNDNHEPTCGELGWVFWLRSLLIGGLLLRNHTIAAPLDTVSFI